MVQKDIGFPNGDMRNAAGTANIGGKGWRLRPEAARALEALASAFRSRFAYTLPILETHRSLAEQQRLWDLYQSGQGNLAARPGTSVHGWGLAIDLGSPLNLHGSTESEWMRSNMGDYGFWDGGQASWPQKEPWHIEYRGGGSKEPGTSTIGTYTVKEGDTLRSIAISWHMSEAVLAKLNGLQVGAAVKAGQKLKVETKYAYPFGTGTPGTYRITTWPDAIYFLERGMSQREVAVKHQMSVAVLRRANRQDEEEGWRRWPAGLGIRVKVNHLPKVYKYLDQGSTETIAVAQVQERLGLEIDGIYGPATFAAVANFQRGRSELGASGKVDHKTWVALFGA